ncbi:ABC transporter permease [Blastococcus xanthinilyticus]|uniref:Transport permease protein n=1 Tax=Blastococcus xanthinilyticus TaxID=1564164 RepID=A0A5S5D327_9ACTN|nr:ABC transporter permease [Blastococcus xanthinilyticus]TYP89029.1 ABC-2 type transport system permease protein [Blastococcus xanthinilyticus]
MTAMYTTPTTDTRSGTGGAGAAVLRAEARLFGRELGSLFWILLFPTILLLILGAIPDFREADPSLGGQRVVDLYASIAVLLAMIMAAILAMPAVIAGYREHGVLRRLRTTPVHPGALLAAQVGLHAAAVLVSVVLALGVARLAYGVLLPRSLAFYALCTVLATAATFAIGAVITASARSARAVQTVGTIVFFPTMFTAGVWLPVQSMGGWLHDVVVRTPLGAAAEALNDALVGRTPDGADLAVMMGWTAVLALVSVRAFRWE